MSNIPKEVMDHAMLIQGLLATTELEVESAIQGYYTFCRSVQNLSHKDSVERNAALINALADTLPDFAKLSPEWTEETGEQVEKMASAFRIAALARLAESDRAYLESEEPKELLKTRVIH